MLWGSYAQRKGAVIDRARHLVLETAHPSPLSAYRGFFGCGHFLKADAYLRAHGIEVFHSDRFRVGTAPADSFLRISVSNARSEKTLASHLRALARKLKGGAPGDAPSASRFRTET